MNHLAVGCVNDSTFKMQGCRSRGGAEGAMPPRPSFGKLALSQPGGVGHIIPTKLHPLPPGLSDLPTALKCTFDILKKVFIFYKLLT